MNQQKIGNFLKQLRGESGLTQEKLAEHFCVSSRTVSRWETGNNLPAIDILIDLADYYDVDIRELLDGERKRETINYESKETLKKVADYSTSLLIEKTIKGALQGTLTFLVVYLILNI